MRVLVAGLIGGILVFAWGALAHMLLPIGEMGFRTAVGQESAISAIQASAEPGDGVYMLPGMSPEQWQDEGQRAAFIQRYESSPYAFVVYRADGNPAMASMGPSLVKQFLSVFAGAVLMAWILSSMASGFGRRVLVAGCLGLFAWLAVSVPYWNWYRFPTDFTLAALVEQVVGWTLGGAGAAWWLGRRRKG
ncbi:hypothetical protein [Luteimonas vadosa]|uniref:hypothetical protein n=1 Tax=Luteimonas vadosa TaxID=1165507 RepID=UPI0031E89352